MNKTKFATRWGLILGLFSSLWLLLVLRAFQLQVFPDSRLGQLKNRQFETVLNLPARRGIIFDKWGRELAVSVPSYSVFADPSKIERPPRTAGKLSRVLHISVADLLGKLEKTERQFVWLKRFLTQEERAKIEKLGLKGIGFREELKRVYPNDSLLSQALGFVGSDGKGLEGLEAEYDAILQGSDKRISLKRDARGRPLLVNGQMFIKRPDGADIHVTIDGDLQFELERELVAVVEEQRANSAVGLILDAQSSDILAMATAPLFNPNRIKHSQADVRRNRAVVDSFEPGSTMKTFVLGAALEKGLIVMNSKVFCENGFWKIGQKTVREADARHRFGWLNPVEILAHSSNVGAAKIGEMLGEKNLRGALENYGFGSRTGIELPAESKGILNPLPWGAHQLATISFGHGIAVSPIQIATAYAAIASGGVLRKPRLVKKIEAEESGFLAETQIDPGKRVMSAATAQSLTLMLMAATGHGSTGVAARVRGYPVAGKTGTAQKVDLKQGGYLNKGYISSFAGYIPAHRPRFVIYVAVDEPRKTYYGSQVAAPVFSRLAQFAAERAGIAPVLLTEKDVMQKAKKVELVGPASSSRITANTASRNPVSRSLVNRITATQVPTQVQSPGMAGLGLAGQQTDQAKAGLQIDDEQENPSRTKKIPLMKGLSLREALRVIKAHDMDVRVFGSGRVVNSSPAEGGELPRSKTVKIYLAN